MKKRWPLKNKGSALFGSKSFLLIEEKNQGFMLKNKKKGFVFQLTVKYSKILDISMQKIQSIDFGDKKSANENL